jgi:hypothetical protein
MVDVRKRFDRSASVVSGLGSSERSIASKCVFIWIKYAKRIRTFFCIQSLRTTGELLGTPLPHIKFNIILALVQAAT